LNNGGDIALTADPREAAAARGAAGRRRGRTRSFDRLAHSRGRLVRRALVTADLVGLTVAFFVTFAVFRNGTQMDSVRFGLETVLFLFTLPFWVIYAWMLDLYGRDDGRADHSTADETLAVVNLVTVGTWVVFLGAWATQLSHPQLNRLMGFWALALTLVIAGRVVARSMVHKMSAYTQVSVILGAGHVGQLVARKIQQHPEYGLSLLGFVDENPRVRRAEVIDLPILGGLGDLDDLISSRSIDRVIVAFSGEADVRTMALIRSLRDQEVIVDVVPRLYELVGPRADVHLLEGLPLLTVPPARLSGPLLALKRIIDLVGATLLLLLTWPVFILAAIVIRRQSPGPVFFRQSRLGENMRPFTLFKFRTMRVDTDDSEHREFIKGIMSSEAEMNENGAYKLERENAVTPFGRFLRKTSLDELPQLINVLRGEMSLVGPRPCIEYETEFFQPHHFDRFLVPQGITGLWQVTARANSTFGEALEMDVAYVRGWSLGLDLRLIFRTPFALLRQRKATA
jgi:exopolysaccharide biosynthesis polyprenyl glycosylphosphotransferase